MKKIIYAIGATFLIFLLIFSFSYKVQAGRVLITSIGQNPGGLMVKVVLNKMNVDFTYEPLIQSDELEEYDYAILSVGCSQKGLCAADCSFDDELKRTKDLIAAIDQKGYQVILVHLGGKLKRDDKSNKLINQVAPISSHFVITEESNVDDYFSHTAKEKNIELHIVEKLSKLEVVFEEIFNDKN